MSHAEHLQRQRQSLEKALAILTQDKRVLGISIGGSCAQDRADAFSDIDLCCYLYDEARTGHQEIYEQVGKIAPLLCKLRVYDLHALYLFTDGVRLDLDIHPASAISAYRQSSNKILYDPQSALQQQLESASEQPDEAEHPQYFATGDPAYLDWFLWMFRQIYCWTKRGAQGTPKGLNKLLGAYDSLNQVRNSLIQMRLWTLESTGYLTPADPDFAARIARTFPHLVPQELLEATRLLLTELEHIGPAYCEKAGSSYPAGKVETLKRQLDEFDCLV